MSLKKIVYLFGAGATHAEILNLKGADDAKWRDANGLLISDVSKRVMKTAQKERGFINNVKFVTAAEGSLNIELLISLFASSQIPHANQKVKTLKKLVKTDITKKLSNTRRKTFYLHKALIELHKLINYKEVLCGLISLNYDDVLDDACKVNGMPFDYCHSPEKSVELPLLKLHGSFNWTSVEIYGRSRELPIIPLGINKNYLNPPYNFIWGRAYDLLVQCDVLRIIGCSISQNDIGLVDLLFKAHLERENALEMQIIDFQTQGDIIKNNYGFFPGIVKPKDIEDAPIVGDSVNQTAGGGNPFKNWLMTMAQKMVEDEIEKTKYLKKCF